MKYFIFSFLIYISQAELGAWRAARAARANSNNKSYHYYRKNYDTTDEKRKNDSEAITILYWWAEDPAAQPWMRHTNGECGGCYFTNDRDLEKSVDSIIFDNTRFLKIQRGSNTNPSSYRNQLPDLGIF